MGGAEAGRRMVYVHRAYAAAGMLVEDVFNLLWNPLGTGPEISG